MTVYLNQDQWPFNSSQKNFIEEQLQLGLFDITRVIHAFLNPVKGICSSMFELQQLNSFNSGLFLVYWYIFTAWTDLEP